MGWPTMLKRILHCIASMGGGGAERQLTYLCHGLVQLDWDVHVAIFHDGPNMQRLRDSGATIHQLKSRGHHDPANAWRTYRLIQALNPTLVQTWLPLMDSIGGIACGLAHVPHVISERTASTAYEKTWKNQLRTLVAKRASGVISNSQDGDSYWEILNRNDIRRYIIPNALPLREIEASTWGDSIRQRISRI